MPIITAIKPQKNKKRVNIYLDGKFGFGIDLENLMKLALKVEQELTEKEIEEIIRKAEFQKTYDKLVRFTTLRPRSKKEIDTWLMKHKVYESLHKELFNKLKRLELLDDKKFTWWWIEQRTTFRPRGKRALFAELRQKGIDRDLIKEILDEAEIDEEKIACQLLEKKRYKWEKLPKLEAKKKMSEFLARKGFSWEIIKQAIKEFTD
ncbi:MAG: RecX family transcriptional regulator [Microgenomates group bacterium]